MKHYVYKLLSDCLGGMQARGEIATIPSIDITTPEPAFGDYATNVALKLAKEAKKNPRELAQSIIDHLRQVDTTGHFESISEAAGFINFTVSQNALFKNLQAILEQQDLYGASVSGEGKTIVVEYFQNNVAKPPHVGHIRSAVIGDCLTRVLKSQGFKTISDTHIGDWGVQFGILIYAYKTMGDRAVIEKDPITELNNLYVAMSKKIEEDPGLRDKGKEEFVKLEKGDAENRELWQWFVRISLEDFETYRKLLNILPFDHNLGESFYEGKMSAVLEELTSKGLVKKGETGEQYIDLEDVGLGRCILVKSDGGTTYHLRDFATYLHRRKEFNFFKNIYVVDNRQSHHFKQLFKALEFAGYPVQDDSMHVEFGFMSLPEGAISTRKGTTVSLQNWISEAEKRALKIIEEKNPELENKHAVAQQVAVAAIKYFDLSHNRKSEIVFTWEHALSFEGNTGPYLQYTHARIHGILRKAENAASPFIKPEIIVNDQENTLLRKLQQFPQIVEQVSVDLLPNLLANYLFELSQTFNGFYQDVPVLQEEDADVRSFRLQLVTATAQILANGLYLMGIEAPEQM